MGISPQEFARKYLGRYKTKGDELVPEYCIFCHGGSHKDKYTFALNARNMTYNCRRGSCAKQGHFSQLCKEFGEEYYRDNTYEKYVPKKTYKKPQTQIVTPQQKVEAYLKLRGFSKETWERRGVGESGGNIVFPYYENGELVMVKFRKPEKYNGIGQNAYRDWETDRKSTRLNSSHSGESRMPSSA